MQAPSSCAGSLRCCQSSGRAAAYRRLEQGSWPAAQCWGHLEGQKRCHQQHPAEMEPEIAGAAALLKGGCSGLPFPDASSGGKFGPERVELNWEEPDGGQGTKKHGRGGSSRPGEAGPCWLTAARSGSGLGTAWSDSAPTGSCVRCQDVRRWRHSLRGCVSDGDTSELPVGLAGWNSSQSLRGPRSLRRTNAFAGLYVYFRATLRFFCFSFSKQVA